MKVIKQGMEIQKLKEELEKAEQEKKDIETEIEGLNRENYEINEKLILNEISKDTVGTEGDIKSVKDLEQQIVSLEKHAVSDRDLQKMVEALDRIKCDIEVLQIQDRLKKDKDDVDSESKPMNGSDEEITDQTDILDSIQDTIDYMKKVQIKMSMKLEGYDPNNESQTSQEFHELFMKSAEKILDMSVNNTTMQADIDLINKAVDEPMLRKSSVGDDSFLFNVNSDELNTTKFQNASDLGITASALEEQKNKIDELEEFIQV